MKRFILAGVMALLSMIATVPAQAHDGWGGGRCCGYAPFYAPYYYGYSSYYYAPPPTYYYAPQPTVVYAQPVAPAPVQYVAPPPTAVNQAPSPNFIDSNGLACRRFQTPIDGSMVDGVACQQPDGTWKTVAQ